MIHAGYVEDMEGSGMLDPEAAAWRTTGGKRLRLMGTPLGLQPTAAIRATWAGKKIGVVDQVEVRAAHDGRQLAFRLQWSDASESRTVFDSTDFADAAAVLLPATPDSPLPTMGAPGKAVNAWYWRADEPEGSGRQVVAEGLGTTRTVDLDRVRTRAMWKGERWRLVIARALHVSTSEPVAQLAPGSTTSLGVAVWEGSHSERAGIKAFSGQWVPLRLAAAPAARR